MKAYPTHLSDSQWQRIEKFFDMQRKRKYELRAIVNAIFYVVKSGCQWRMLPSDFASWQLVYYYYRKWKINGLIELIHDELVRIVRRNKGREQSPSVGIIDSQSVKGTSAAGEHRGYDAGKKVTGRKRHIIVDTLGLVLGVIVHSASVQDRDGAMSVIELLRFRFSRMVKIFADGGYAGKLIDQVAEKFGWVLEIVHKKESGFKVLPKRWIVERTFAWINNDRRNSKDYERLIESSETMIRLSMIRCMLKNF